MKDITYKTHEKMSKTTCIPHNELKEKPDDPIRIKKDKRFKLQARGVHIAHVFTRILFFLRNSDKKKHRFIPIALLLYFLVFLLTSLFSLIGGTSASASTQQATHGQNLHSVNNSSAVHINIGNLDVQPSNLLDCTASTTTKTNSDGTATSSLASGKYIPGGSPTPTCENGRWSCPVGGNDGNGYFVPASMPGNGTQEYVICFSAGSISNPTFTPGLVTKTLDTCDAASLYSGDPDLFVKTHNVPAVPVCTDVPGIDGKVWICPPTYKVIARHFVRTGDNSNGGPEGYEEPLQCDYMNQDWVFPCSDISDSLPNVGVIQADWLSGNHPAATSAAQQAPASGVGGRFFYTFAEDTFKLDGVTKLMPYTLGIGLLLLSPVIVLLGYQVLLGSITFRYANALQTIPRLVFGVAIIFIAFTMTETLISICNGITGGLVLLHKDLGFPSAMVNCQPVAYTLPNENDPVSYRGMVVPMSRWGCAANEFVKILAAKFFSDVLASVIPIFGNLVHLVATIANFFDMVRHLGQFILLVLSIMLWAQVLVRIVLLNYYILLCPMAFGCWALPGGVGQNVVNQWTKGFFSTLFIQIVQVFIITTLPLIIPALPAIPSDSLGLMKGLLTQLPPILVLWMTVRAPAILGTSTARAITNAGSIAGGVVTAVGAAAYNIV